MPAASLGSYAYFTFIRNRQRTILHYVIRQMFVKFLFVPYYFKSDY